MIMHQPREGVIHFAERLMEVLEEGLFSSTYKFAVLIGLMDLCLERSQKSGRAPESVTTRQLAQKIIEIYWPHAVVYPGIGAVLCQNSGKQAEILSEILRFRVQYAPEASTSTEGASLKKPADYKNLVRTVEWKLIEMPLPRLQTVGNTYDRFIYEIGWDTTVRRKDISSYQNGRGTHFDNNIRFKPLVGDYFLQLNHLLRPLIYRKWTSLVAQFNKLPDSELESFLFERLRISTAPIREPLWEMQKRRCFYCEGSIPRLEGAEVDHFLPWSRFPDNGIENLVIADRLCNHFKKDFLAGTSHLVRWRTRFDPTSLDRPQVKLLAESTGWDSHPDKTMHLPLIYFYGLVPRRYAAEWPVYIVADDPGSFTFSVEIGERERLMRKSDGGVASLVAESATRSYTTILTQRRLHQQSFRYRVLEAYRQCCAICRLRHDELLDAAHILPDGHPRGEPWVSNGLALCKLHHAAFDAHILGVRPDLTVEIRRDVLEESDGPILLHGLKECHNKPLVTLPRPPSLKPRRDFLEERYELFRRAG